MPAPHALYGKMLAERTASRNVLVLFYFILFIDFDVNRCRRAVYSILDGLVQDTSASLLL